MRSTLVLLSILAAAVPAHAEPSAAAAADAAYQEGRRLYDLHEWDRAIAKFKESYALRSDAPSLFNIAQAYRLAGDCAQAVSFYKTYARNFPHATNLDKVTKFLRELEPCPAPAPEPEPRPAAPPPSPSPSPTVSSARVPPAPAPAPVTTAARPPEPHVAVAPHAPEAGRAERIAAVALGAAGIAAIGAGGLFAYQGHQKASKVESGTGTWDPQLQRDGRAANLRAELALGLGGAALITGGILYYLGHRAGERAPVVGVAPSAHGGILVWSRGF
jgi:tetratricopeptide (TPR) repeat protein